MKKLTIGFAMCGSFCTFSAAIEQMKKLSDLGYGILPIMSFNAGETDTRFGKAEDFKQEILEISGKTPIEKIVDAEPIGPQKMADLMLIAPCTGNTLSKICGAVTDTPVTMAVKSHIRVEKPVLIALATNDGLAASAQNIGKMLNIKHFYFVPMKQDDPVNKPTSLVADFDLIPDAVELALKNKQKRPVFLT